MAANNGCSTYRPEVDENAPSCPDGFHSTDCIYVSEKANTAYLGMSEIANVTDLIDCLVNKIKEQDRAIRNLESRINRLNNN